MSTTAYLVVENAYEYNDEYYAQTDGGTFESTAHTDKSVAEARADAINVAHARTLCQEGFHSWFYAGVSEELVDSDLREFVRIMTREALPEGATPTAIRKRADKIDTVSDPTDEQLRWLVDHGLAKIARVEEIEIV